MGAAAAATPTSSYARASAAAADVRILMLTHYPPMRGGISAYGDQAVARLREQGHVVEVASPEPSEAEHVLDVRVRRSRAAVGEARQHYDRLVVQFHPEMLGGSRLHSAGPLAVPAATRQGPSGSAQRGALHPRGQLRGRVRPLRSSGGSCARSGNSPTW